MTFATVAAAGLTAGIGYLSSRSSNRAATNAQNAQNDAIRQQIAMAQQQYDDWRTSYRPLEQGMLTEAQEYDSPERRDAAAAQAAGDVNMAFGRQRESVGSNLASYGIQPGAKYAATFARLGGQQAAASAGSQNVARRAVEEQGWGRRYAMAGLGRNLLAGASGGLSSASAGLGALAASHRSQANQAAAGAGTLFGPIINRGMDRIFNGGGGGGSGLWQPTSGLPTWDSTPGAGP